MKADEFCIFILSNGRPDRVYTYRCFERANCIDNVYIVIDDEDQCAEEYQKRFPGKVIVFNKAAMDGRIDKGDNFEKRNSTLWPRASFWKIAENLGFKYFVQLDDDYTDFQYFFDKNGVHKYAMAKRTLMQMFEVMFEFYKSANIKTLAMAQGGDFIGGAREGEKKRLCRLRRKAMNVFLCSCDRPWSVLGRRNEDVTAYVMGNLRGDLFFTTMQAKITQVQTQKNPGLITDGYIESGTYVKSFYTVMYAPSCVKIGAMGDHRVKVFRIHHKINWHNCAPKILREECKHA